MFMHDICESNMDSITTQLRTYDSWKYEYDVFLSCRSADTRHGFAEHLYRNLHQKRIKTFICDVDDDVLGKEKDILGMLYKAIEESRISIIIFSENYASSECCLDELVKALQCKQSSKQQIVWPIFYKVNPLDVRDQKGNFGEGFAHLQRKFKDDMEKVFRWRTVLTQATKLSGWCFLEGHEGKFVNEIIEKISVQVLNRTYLNVAKYPIGIESRVQEMDELLGVGVNDVRIVGIWGAASGIGKTTIAKAVYNSIAHEFEGGCFLENVRENSMERGGLVKLQKILLSQVLGEEILEEETNVIKKMLSHKRVLLILDDVNELDQLNKLAGGSDWFGLGSRILITTRHKDLLNAHQVDLKYEVKELDPYEAFELFSWNAFPRNRLSVEYVKLANSIINYAQGLPLALTVMGSLLCGRSIDQWQAVLDSYKRAPNLGIQEIIRITYNVLACDPENALLNDEENHFRIHDMPDEMVHEDVSHVLTINHETKEGKVIEEKLLEPNEIFLSAKSFSKGTSSEWVFLLTGLCLEILSIAFDQASSPSKPQYALFGLVLAIAALLLCICELIHNGKKERVELRRWGKLWWFYHKDSHTRHFGTLSINYGLLGGISQCACSAVQYVCFIRHAQNPIKASVGPAIFLICLGASRLSENRRDETIELTK